MDWGECESTNLRSKCVSLSLINPSLYLVEQSESEIGLSFCVIMQHNCTEAVEEVRDFKYVQFNCFREISILPILLNAGTCGRASQENMQCTS